MAEWQYRIERVQINAESDSDTKLAGILGEYGAQGWELVQIMREQAADNQACRLIFKAEKPID